MYFLCSKDERILIRRCQCFSLGTEFRSSNESEGKRGGVSERFEEQKECMKEKSNITKTPVLMCVDHRTKCNTKSTSPLGTKIKECLHDFKVTKVGRTEKSFIVKQIHKFYDTKFQNTPSSKIM